MNEPCITPRQMMLACLAWTALTLGGMWASYSGQQKIIDALKVELHSEQKAHQDLFEIYKGLCNIGMRYETEAVNRGYGKFVDDTPAPVNPEDDDQSFHFEWIDK